MYKKILATLLYAENGISSIKTKNLNSEILKSWDFEPQTNNLQLKQVRKWPLKHAMSSHYQLCSRFIQQKFGTVRFEEGWDEKVTFSQDLSLTKPKKWGKL